MHLQEAGNGVLSLPGGRGDGGGGVIIDSLLARICLNQDIDMHSATRPQRLSRRLSMGVPLALRGHFQGTQPNHNSHTRSFWKDGLP